MVLFPEWKRCVLRPLLTKDIHLVLQRFSKGVGYCPLLFEFCHRSHESFGLEVEFTRLELLFIPTIRIPFQSLLTAGAASV